MILKIVAIEIHYFIYVLREVIGCRSTHSGKLIDAG